jgi:ubiquinone/menaquinone biosynthesis C-methylase UbiE
MMPGMPAAQQHTSSFAKLYRALMVWGFNRLYRECAWSYDSVAWLVSRGLWYRWVLAALPFLQGRVLEVGCGTGVMQRALAACAPGTAVGLDASPFMLRLTRRRLARLLLSARLLRAVTQRMPFAAHSFDTVLATFPAEYILHPATLAEIRRVLTDTGRLVIVDAACFTSDGWYERLIDLAFRLTLQDRKTPTLPESPQHAPRQHIYADVLARAGFAVQVHPVPIDQSQVQVFVATPALAPATAHAPAAIACT